MSAYVTAAQLLLMDKATSDLEGELIKARAVYATTWYILGGADSAKSAIDSAGNSLDYLEDEGRDRVIDGKTTFAAWVDAAEAIHDSLSAVFKLSSEWGLLSSLKKAAVGTAENIATAAKEAADLTPYVAVLAAVLGVVYLVGRFAK